ncbi:glycoside hydrolase family 95 protein [bacterium BMS3Abin03]|nr:glycoside hydrolase family 95 protein [bacterium BMS3Abin03]
MKKIARLIKGFTLILSAVLLFSLSTCLVSGQKSPEEKRMVIWYNKPAGDVWTDGLLIGNGYMGANVFGRVENERIALNESTFWSGRPHDYNDPDAHNYFEKIKKLVFADKFKEAEEMVNEHFYGKPVAQQAYQPLADLLLKFNVSDDSIKDYYRELDMETGVVKVSYTDGDVKMTREVFMSYPDHVLVMKISANEPGSISVEAKLKSHFTDETITQNNKLILNGTWKYVAKNDSWLIAKVDKPGMNFQTYLVAKPEKGSMKTTDSSLVVKNANSVTFVLTAATSFVNYHDISGDPAARVKKIMEGIKGKSYNELLNIHLKDFSSLMSRVQLKIGDPLMNKKPTDERITDLKKGLPDIDLLAKIFQFGRYLLLSSSRKGSEPANLQARWDEELMPNWGSKYTLNINTEMNYWPAEVTNLPECHMPLFDMLKDLAENGAKTAREYYNARGWVVHHNTDLWRGTAPVDAARYGMWPMGGSWLCRHIWEHYLYTGDTGFLREYYPIMKGSAQFLMDIMDFEPKHHWLVVPFSVSPEQGYFVDDNKEEMFLSSSTTMNVGIIKDLFTHCIEAEKILNTDKKFGEELADALKKIPLYQIGKDSLLQVWIEDWKRGDEGHNMSANFGFFPGNSITLRGNPKIAEAIRKWLEPRQARTSWTIAWDICDWARLENGEKADTVIRGFFHSRPPAQRRFPRTPRDKTPGINTRTPIPPWLRSGIGNNLHNTSSNQSDANFGFAAGIAECLLQSHAGEISLLPALPPSWKTGSVTGLKARGGFEVNISWENGKLSHSEIKSLLGNPFVVRYGEKTKSYNIPAGSSIKITGEL